LFFGLAFGLITIINLTLKKTCTEKSFRSVKERLYEVIFSGTSILFFIANYYLIDRFLTAQPFLGIWQKYQDFLLLVLLIMSCLFNSILDHFVIKLTGLSKEERAAGRLIGMVYMIMIFAYVKFIYENNNYDKFIVYFLGLMIGRFAYFDATFKDFLHSVQMASKNLVLMMVTLGYTSVMSFVGFKTGYLLIHNGVIVNVFFAHLFMVASMALLEVILNSFFKNNKRNNSKRHSRDIYDEEFPKSNDALTDSEIMDIKIIDIDIEEEEDK